MPEPGKPQATGSNVLIAYFSMPEDVDTADAIAGASIVVRDGEKLGNTEYVAKLVQQTVGGDLFRIETVEEYPLDHADAVEAAGVQVERLQLDGRPHGFGYREDWFDAYDSFLIDVLGNQ